LDLAGDLGQMARVHVVAGELIRSGPARWSGEDSPRGRLDGVATLAAVRLAELQRLHLLVALLALCSVEGEVRGWRLDSAGPLAGRQPLAQT